MKILIVGGVAGGASAAAKLRRFSEEDQIIMFEKGPHVSFSNCALPYYLSGEIDSAEKLVLMNPQKLKKQYNIEARTNEEIIEIDRVNKKVKVCKVLTKEVYEESYDKLILSPGASPNKLDIPGIECLPHFTVRNVVDISKVASCIVEHNVTKVTIMGGGYIGIELAENLTAAGYEVTLLERDSQVLCTFDDELVQIFHKELYDKGVNLRVGCSIERISDKTIYLTNGEILSTEMIIMAVGVKPESVLAKEAGLEINPNGTIKVNDSFQTNDPDIYAVGDAIEVNNLLTGNKMHLTLAGPAQKAARAVACQINGESVKKQAYMGSSAIKVFDYNGASTGLTEALIKGQKLNINYDKVHFIMSDKVGIMPNSHPVHFKMIYEVPTGKILGAQAIGKGEVDKRINAIATAIKLGGTVYDLTELEFCYAPPFATAKDIVNYAGYIACNLLEGKFKQITVDQIRRLVEEDAYLLDVRENMEYENGHIKGAHHIPLSELRGRINEIPKDKPVYIHCRTGQRSYNATLALQNLGYNNVVNVTGSFLALSFYEYYLDQTKDRKSILTAYNFN